jgi:nicotinamidase/pyrazinamidase
LDRGDGSGGVQNGTTARPIVPTLSRRAFSIELAGRIIRGDGPYASPGAFAMLDGPLVFVDVDTQRDFLEPDGALFIVGSGAIRPNLARLTRFALDHGIPILATACAHLAGDLEFASFRPHCLIGTPGQGRVAETAVQGGPTFEPNAPLPEPIPPHLTIPKHEYDVFSNPDASRLVDHYAKDNPTFVVYGVATDYCVKCAVEGLLNRGKKVALVVDAIRPVDPVTEAGLLTEFANRGALLTLADVVCG